MFHRVREYPLITATGRLYRPRAYGDQHPRGSWDGWIVFFPLRGGTPIAPAGPETSQTSFAALELWAAGITPVYLEGALVRALDAADHAAVIDRLAAAEYEALEDAARLETEAQLERTRAQLDEIAAEDARIEAEQIRRDRLTADRVEAARDEAAAEAAAQVHEAAAVRERETAAAARRRRRAADSAGESRPASAAKKR